MNRRNFLKMTLATSAAATPWLLNACNSATPATTTTAAPSSASSAVNGAPIKIGFIPLTDCASVVMADKLGLYKQYGVNVEVSKEASWANIRDKLLTGELDAAHCLFSMPLSVYTGVGELPVKS